MCVYVDDVDIDFAKFSSETLRNIPVPQPLSLLLSLVPTNKKFQVGTTRAARRFPARSCPARPLQRGTSSPRRDSRGLNSIAINNFRACARGCEQRKRTNGKVYASGSAGGVGRHAGSAASLDCGSARQTSS